MTMQSATEKAAFWELGLDSEQQPTIAPSAVQPCVSTSGTVDIGIFDPPPDIRMAVEEADIKSGGKCRPILKLFFRSENSETWITATGWLLKDDLVVTAAHCVYNKGQRATCVNACIGYSESSKTTNISADEQRFVKRIALPFEWMSAETERYDVAFLQLNSPFKNVTPIARGTPEINARQQFTVIGYPTDLRTGGEPGSKMYEMKIARDINLENTKQNMLAYQGDLQGGFSGAPVIRDSDFAAIGVHVFGGTFNSAVVIDGLYGVKFQVYEELMKTLDEGSVEAKFEVKTDDNKDWLKYVDVPCSSLF